MKDHLKALQKRLSIPGGEVQIGLFRALFGAVILAEVVQRCLYKSIEAWYEIETIHAPYPEFPFIEVLPLNWMYVLYAGMGLAALGLMLGVRARLCAGIFGVLFAWVTLMKYELYNNHYYGIMLLCLVFVCIPSSHRYSLPWHWGRAEKYGNQVWHLWWLRFHILLIYAFGAIAKLHPDWFDGQTMEALLATKGWRFSNMLIIALSYGGLMVDTLIPLFLLWPRMRWWGIGLGTIFSVSNHLLFDDIGVFPFLMLGAMVLFIENRWLRFGGRTPKKKFRPDKGSEISLWQMGLLSGYLGFHLLFPFRHYLIEGDVRWTEQGGVFSWLMKSHTKSVETFPLVIVTDPAKQKKYYYAYGADFPIPEVSVKFFADPYLIWYYVQHIVKKIEMEGVKDPEIRIQSRVGLNGRKAIPIVDETVDLTKVDYKLYGKNTWVMPGPD